MDLKIIADYHTHTNIAKGNFPVLHKAFGEHARGTILQNSIIAIKKGLREIAITDHGSGQIFYGMKRELYKIVREEIDEVNNMFFNKGINFKVLLGIEGNITNKNGDLDFDDSILDYFDLICAGYHRGCLNDLTLKKNYTEAVINAISKNKIAILNHPCDHITPDVIEVGKIAAINNTAIELNRKHTNISIEEIKKLKAMGVMFSLGSDSHYSKDVGEFGAAYDLALKAELTVNDIINGDGAAHKKISYLRKDNKIQLENEINLENINMPLKIIFVSGNRVILDAKEGNRDSNISFNSEALKNLSEILEKTNSYIIITSSLRKQSSAETIIKNEFKKYNIEKYLLGYTSLKIGLRKDKIMMTLKNLGEYVDDFIILDSRKDLGDTLNKHLITCENGINNIIREKVINRLDN